MEPSGRLCPVKILVDPKHFLWVFVKPGLNIYFKRLAIYNNPCHYLTQSSQFFIRILDKPQTLIKT